MRILRLLVLLPLCWAISAPAGLCASNQLKPVLKAIDPSTAKTDSGESSKPPPPPSPNPLGRITGAPVSPPPKKPAPAQPAPGPSTPSPPQNYTPYQPQYGAPPAGYGYPAPNQQQGYPQPGGYPPQQQYPPQAGYPPPQSGYPPPQGGYPPPQAGYPPPQQGYPPPQQGYPPPQQGYSPPQQGYPPPQQGYPPPQQGYPPPQQGYRPAQQGYPPVGYPAQQGYPPVGYPAQQGYPPVGYPQQQPGYPPAAGSQQQSPDPPQLGGSVPPAYSAPPGYQAPPASARGGAFPSEDQIPDFGKPMPGAAPATAPTAYGGQPPAAYAAPPTAPYGQGWGTQPPVYTPPPPVASGDPNAPPQSPTEQRLTKLEQMAFGSTYPEHEDDDRIDHLEKEVFGSTSNGNLLDRIAKVEGKLSGHGAFTQAGATGAPPVVATAYTGNAGTPTTRQDQSSVAQPKGAVPQHGIAAGATSTDFNTAVNAIPEDKKAGDYFSQIRRFPAGTVARWTSFPIRIRLPQDTPQSWQTSLDSGVRKWGQHLPIKIAGAHDPADIDTTWTNHLAPGQLGVTRVQVANGKMQVVVYLLRPTFYLPSIPERSLHGVYLHELGHALGIFGHSDNADDIMEPTENSQGGSKNAKFNNVTPRDLNTLKKIYLSPPLPKDFSVQQPIEWE